MTAFLEQLALQFPHNARFRAGDFLQAPSNEAARLWLARSHDWPEARLALWGQPGCGKTHLLHIWAERAGANILAGSKLGEAVLPQAAVAIDRANEAPEQPLLHLLNAAREAGHPVLLAATAPPARWTVRLLDLASRLRATTAIEIGAPEDALLRALLSRLLADRQLLVPESLQAWLLLRLPRSPGVLRQAVARLDRASLASGGKIARPLAAAVLSDLIGPSDSDCRSTPTAKL